MSCSFMLIFWFSARNQSRVFRPDSFLIVGEIDRMLVNSNPDKQKETDEEGEEA